MIRRKDYIDFSHVNKARLNGKFCDVNIRVGDQSFPCHRIILFASMKYFRSLLGGDFAEAESEEIQLNGVNADDFEHVLTYVYGGSVSVSESNVLDLLILANYLGLQIMEEACIENIVKNNATFSSDSVLKIFRFACTTKISTLMDALIQSMAKNFQNFIKSREFHRVQGSDLMKIFTHLNMKREPVSEILNFLKEWIRFQSNEERKLLPDILNALNVQELRGWILEMLINTDYACQSNTEQYEHKNDLEKLCLSREEINDNEEEVERPPVILFTHEFSQDKPFIISKYKVQRAEALQYLGTVTSLQYSEGMTDRFFCKLFSIRGVLFTIRSYETQKTGLNSVHCISVFAKSSSELEEYGRHLNSCQGPTLLPPWSERNVFTAALNDHYIYLYNNVNFIKYDCEQNRWFKVDGYSDNDHPIFAPSMTSLGPCLYMAGGLAFRDQCPLTDKSDTRLGTKILDSAIINTGKSFKMYDVREKKWLQLPNMKYSRVKAASCAYNDTIYVSGGDNLTYFENPNIEYYDIRAGKWSEIATPMPKAKMGHCCTAYNDYLGFFGGMTLNRDDNDNTWFSYNLKENTWSKIFSIPASFSNRTISRIVDVHPCIYH